MWFKKKKDSFGFTQEQRKLIDEVAKEAVQTVACCGCGCIILKNCARIVTQTGIYTSRKVIFCSRCAPPYDEAMYTGKKMVYYQTIPEHIIEVTKEGKEIKKDVSRKNKK